MSAVTIGEIVDFLGGRYEGPRDLVIRGVAPLREASGSHLSFLANPKYESQLASSGAAAVLVPESHAGSAGRLIRVANPYFSMAEVVRKWFAGRRMPEGISPLASIAATATIGRNAGIAPFVTIGENVVIGDDVHIYSNVSIESDVHIGDGTIIYPQVSIYAGSLIGKRCILHSGVVIGGDGFGFATEGGKHHKIPQIGIVRIEDDVEIGANSTVDRAALGETVIGEGTKIDNLVMVAHNVRIGRHCLLVSQAGVAGSTQLGDYVVIAGQSGVAGHLVVGDGTMIAAKTAVTRNWPAGVKLMGFPAEPAREFLRTQALMRKLPELLDRVKELEKRLGESGR
jgi:UDP-3-O-[3-hydroxymyristoyl] glucosamine N-acyltransferase